MDERQHVTQDARPSGASNRQRVLVKRTVSGRHKAIRFWRHFSRPPSSTSGVECGIGPVWT